MTGTQHLSKLKQNLRGRSWSIYLPTDTHEIGGYFI